MDLRQLRYFVAVAEEKTVTRAAARVYLAQPSLSQQIKVLERGLGVRLFDRRPYGMVLTAAGERLYQTAVPLLRSADAVEAEMRRLSEPPVRELTVGVFDGLGLGALNVPMLEAFRRASDGARIHVVRVAVGDQAGVLRRREADVVLARPPLEDDDIAALPLLEEPRVAVLPARHPLAGEAELDAQDLAEETFYADRPSSDRGWHEYHRLEDVLGTGRTRVGPEHPADFPSALFGVALGGVITAAGASCRRAFGQDGLAYVPVRDVPGSVGAIAYRRGEHEALTGRLCEAATGAVERFQHLVPDARLTVSDLAG